MASGLRLRFKLPAVVALAVALVLLVAPLVSADFSDDNRIIATGRTTKGIDIWEVASGKLRETWKPAVKHKVQPDSATILDLRLDPNSKTLISESSSGIGQRWALN